MHTSAHSHPHLFGTKLNPANVAVTLLVALLFLIFLFLLLTLLPGTAQAQNSMPPTARQAATMPQFASRLVHPTPMHAASRVGYPALPRASYKNPLDPRMRAHRGGPLDANEIYDNGPINGTTDAWTINFGFVVSDSFAVPAGSSGPSGMTFGAWLFSGDVLQTVEVSITSSEFGGTTYFDQVLSFTQSGCSGNQYGFNVCTETSSNVSTVNLAAGTYWVNLSNAVVNSGDPVYWDENSGVGCGGQGCPSSASENSVGTIPSEAFTVEGGNCEFNCPPECVQDGESFNGAIFQIIHNFSSSEQSPAPGLGIDQESRLYGASSGGNNGAGLAYELAPSGENWIFTPLYNFLGGLFGQGLSPETIGPEKALYGTASGGLQQCGTSGNQYCGVVYRLRPSPVACLTALCGWGEEVIYRFTGNPDGWSPNGRVVFDQAGNLYGATAYGGAYGQGAVYELTPANGGWTEKVIYSFTAENGSGYPSSLFAGLDGNLYGVFNYSPGAAVIFQLVPSGDSWAENILATFTGCISSGNGGACGPQLTQGDSTGFWGTYDYSTYYCDGIGCFWATFGRAFHMTFSGQIYDFADTYGDLDGCCYGADYFETVVVDPAGNVYATETHPILGNAWARITKLPLSQLGANCYNGLDHTTLVCFGSDDFGGRDMEVNAGGILYGTTGACGSSPGTVWQLTP